MLAGTRTPLKVTVVLPTYNEAMNLPRMVDALFALDLSGHALGILVVDDGSPDGTGELAEQLAAKFPGRIQVMHRKGKMGLGSAYKAGFDQALKSGADCVIQMDCDFSHPLEKIPEMVRATDDADVVVGSRYVKGGGVDKNWSLSRRLISAWGNRYARLVTGMKVHDVTGGFKCWTRKALEGLPMDQVAAGGFTFQIEMNYLCKVKGYRVTEIPIIFTERALGQSKMSSKIFIEGFWRVWQMRFKKY